MNIKAVGGQAPDLVAAPVVTNADDGHFGGLDHLDDCCDASPVPGAHPIDLVHNYQRLLEVLRLV